MKKGNIKYSVNKEKRTCACYLENCENELTDSLPSDKLFVLNALGVLPTIKNRYVGVAKCAQKDDFDEDFGKTLARNRMLRKYYKDCIDAYYNVRGELSTLEDFLTKEVSFYIDRLAKKDIALYETESGKDV